MIVCLPGPHPNTDLVLSSAFAKLRDHPHDNNRPPPGITFNVPDLEPGGLPDLVPINSHTSPPLLQNPLSLLSPAQLRSAVLRQLSLFLRHSAGAIRLTRPAHFFPLFSSSTQPNPLRAFFNITLCFFAAFLSFNLCFYNFPPLSSLSLSKFPFSPSLACALHPSSSSPSSSVLFSQ